MLSTPYFMLNTESSMHLTLYKCTNSTIDQIMFGHQGVNFKMVECSDWGKEFTRKFYMECHRVITHPDAIGEEDTE